MMTVIRDLFKFNGSFRVGSVIIFFVVLMVLLSFLSPYKPRGRLDVPKNLPPSGEYLFGTTNYGQDVFWQLSFAIRNTLVIAGLAVIIGRSIAVLLGAFSGYVGGFTDRVLSSIVDSFIVMPRLPLLILIAFILSSKMSPIGLALILGVLDWAHPSKRYRAQVLSLREHEFTYTAIFSGMGTFKVILREHFPFLVPFLLADIVSGFLWAIGMEITLSILGLSDLSTPTIGTMIYWGNQSHALLTNRLWVLIAPIVATILIVIGFYSISIALSIYLDPRTRLRRLTMRG